MLVSLEPVDEAMLDRLVATAVHEAGPDEVTPAGPTAGWTAERITWLREFHRDRRAGLDGPRAEATWAVVLDGRVVGGARLQRDVRPTTLVAGLWLAGAVRNQGVGHRVLEQLLIAAADAGAQTVCATTSRANHAALAVLRGAGFAPVGDQGEDVTVCIRTRR